MDYKYIEQLLQRYWLCETTTEEEAILRSFFSQSHIPAELAGYRDLFVYEQADAQTQAPGADFDERLLAIVEKQERPVKVVSIGQLSLYKRLRPLMHAAACIVGLAFVGSAASYIFNRQANMPEGWDYDANSYADSYENPTDALETIDDSFQALHDALGASAEMSNMTGDSLAIDANNLNNLKP